MAIHIDEYGHIIRDSSSIEQHQEPTQETRDEQDVLFVMNVGNDGDGSNFGNSYEDRLRRNTPTRDQLVERERTQHENDLWQKARTAVNTFKKWCEKTANSGGRSCWCYAASMYDESSMLWLYWTPVGSTSPYMLSDSRKIGTADAKMFVDYIYEILNSEGFTSAQTYMSDIKVTKRQSFGGLFNYNKEVTVAKGYVITTSW